MIQFSVSVLFISLAIHFCVVLTTADLLHHTTKEVCSKTPDARIINGDAAGEGEFPSQVSILMRGSHSYGGSILTEKWILTTAQVARGNPEDYTVLAGTNILSYGGTFHSVIEVLQHLLYNENCNHDNDLAMMKLRDPITLGKFTQVVPLYEGQLTEGMNGIVVGWGWYMEEYGDISNHLRKAMLQISNHDKCNFAYSEFDTTIQPTQVCAADPLGVAGPCGGDAGGALFVDGKVAGITSWNLACVVEGYPTIFTDVSKYVQWIRDIIKFHP